MERRIFGRYQGLHQGIIHTEHLIARQFQSGDEGSVVLFQQGYVWPGV
jgi:hypothetical protein